MGSDLRKHPFCGSPSRAFSRPETTLKSLSVASISRPRDLTLALSWPAVDPGRRDMLITYAVLVVLVGLGAFTLGILIALLV
jgi:hypothetical protein